MKHICKVTLLETKINSFECPCFKVGDTLVFAEIPKPNFYNSNDLISQISSNNDFCIDAWHDIEEEVYAALQGRPFSKIVHCIDGATFKIEIIDVA